MRAKAYIRFSKSTPIDSTTKTNVVIQLTGLGKTDLGESFQINQSAVTPIQTYVLYWKDRDGCNSLIETTAKKGRPSLGVNILEQNNELNRELIDINQQINKLCDYIKLRFASTPNNQIRQGWLKSIIQDYYAPKEEVKPTPATLFQYIERFLETASLRKDIKTGRYIDRTTLVKYQTTFKILQQFAVYDKKTDFAFEELNLSFYNRYVDFLEHMEYTANTVGRFIKELKAILTQATKDGVNTSLQYKDFKVLTEDIDNVYLTEEELTRIKDAALNETPKQIEELMKKQSETFGIKFKTIEEKGGWHICPATLQWIRDLFLLLAWTASRFSDLDKIVSTQRDSQVITFRQQKTNTKVVIPIHPVVREIFEQYDYSMKTSISNQKFNDYIKIVCMLAGIDTPTAITRTEGGVRRTTTVPKWYLVSSHTGRRSFCTNQYLRKVPVNLIMNISGHKTEKSFLKYIKADKEEHAMLVKDIWDKIYQ